MPRTELREGKVVRREDVGGEARGFIMCTSARPMTVTRREELGVVAMFSIHVPGGNWWVVVSFAAKDMGSRKRR